MPAEANMNERRGSCAPGRRPHRVSERKRRSQGHRPGATTEDLLFLPLHGQKRWETLFQAAGVERNPAIAPSGRFIAYNSDESGIAEVYVRPFPNAGSRRWQISTAGGAGPVWTRGGSEIVYQDSQGGMMAVAVDSDDNEPFSKPTRTVQRRT